MKFRRLAAFFIDYLILELLATYLFYFLSNKVLFITITAISTVSYFLLEGIKFNGRSIGKKLMKIKLIDIKGRGLSFKQVLVRVMFFVIPYLLTYFVSYSKTYLILLFSFGICTFIGVVLLSALFHFQKRNLIDVLTDTAVVSEGFSATDQVQEWIPLERKVLIKTFLVSLGLYLLIFFTFTSIFPDYDTKAQRLLSLEHRLSQSLNRRVVLILNQRYTSNVKPIETLIAKVSINKNEIAQAEQILKETYQQLSSLSPKPLPEQIRVGLEYFEFALLFPATKVIWGNVHHHPHTLTDQIKLCEEQSDGYSCAEAGPKLAINGELDRALFYSKKACDLQNKVGCYNVVCYLCRLNRDSEAFEILKEVINKGILSNKDKRFISGMNQDPDFGCIRLNSEFDALLKFIFPKD